MDQKSANSSQDETSNTNHVHGESIANAEQNTVESLSGIVFIFAGTGSHRWAMGRSLYHDFKLFKDVITRFDDILMEIGATWTIKWLLIESNDTKYIYETNYAQPAICAVQMGIVEILRFYGILPSVIIGQSVGEVAAAYASGMLRFEDAVRLVYFRSLELMKTKGDGCCLAVMDSSDNVKRRLESSGLHQYVDISSFNGPNQVCLSGENTGIKKFEALMEDDGIRTVLVKSDHAYHSFKIEVLKDTFMEKMDFLGKYDKNKSCIPMVSTVTAQYVTYDTINSKEYWWSNMRKQVHFDEALKVLLDDGFKTFIEISGRPVLCNLVKDNILAHNLDITQFLIVETLRCPREATAPTDNTKQICKLFEILQCHGYLIDSAEYVT